MDEKSRPALGIARVMMQTGAEFEALAVLNIDAKAVGQDAADPESTTSTLIDAAELPLPYAVGAA